QTTIEALGHNWGAEIRTESTCQANGNITKTCQRCDKVDKKTLPLADHNKNKVLAKKDAICTAPGLETGYACSMCDKVMVEQKEIPALGHDWKLTSTVPATCTAEGTEYYACKREGCTKTKSETIKMLPHTYEGEWIVEKEATCTEKGSEYKLCTECGYKNSQNIEALGHKEEKLDYVEPTCTNHGREEGTICTVCKEILQGGKDIAPYGHNMTGWFVEKESTCENKGIEKNECKRCEYEEIKFIPEIGHNYPDDWSTVVEPTCTDIGVKVKICFTCHKVVSETLAKLGHADENKDEICDTCGENLKAPTVEHSHEYGEWVIETEPTCTENGQESGVICAACNEVIEGFEEIDALGHTDEDDDKVCDRCETDLSDEDDEKPEKPEKPEDNKETEKKCNCNCHKGGLKGFFWKLINFFEKLFGKNKICKCGAKH
ncbi:MAG: hypothetical protein II356_08045, partial [Clostridia bacterium]|nr:hypothetical protein [Clostridia bacterium]